MGPIAGILYDKYGARTLVIAGTLLHVFGLMMASLATKYYQFLLSQGVCSAIGFAMIYPPDEFDFLTAIPLPVANYVCDEAISTLLPGF